MATSYERVAATTQQQAKTGYIGAQTDYLSGPQTRMTDAQAAYTGQLTESVKLKNKFNRDMNPIQIETAQAMLTEFNANEPLRKLLLEKNIVTAEALMDWYNEDQSRAIAEVTYKQAANELKLTNAKMTKENLINLSEINGINDLFQFEDDAMTDVDESRPTLMTMDQASGKMSGNVSQENLQLADQVWQNHLTKMHNQYGIKIPEGHPAFNPQNPGATMLQDEEGNEIIFPGLPGLGERFNMNHIAGLNYQTGQYKIMSEIGQKLMLNDQKQEQMTTYLDALKIAKGELGLTSGEQGVGETSITLAEQMNKIIGDNYNGWPGYDAGSDGTPSLPDDASEAQIFAHGPFAVAHSETRRAVDEMIRGNDNLDDTDRVPIGDILSKLVRDYWEPVKDYDLPDEWSLFGGADNVNTMLPRNPADRNEFLDNLNKTHENTPFANETPMDYYRKQDLNDQEILDRIVKQAIRQHITELQKSVPQIYNKPVGR